MKKHILLILLLTGSILQSQSVFCMEKQENRQATVTTQVVATQDTQPSLETRLFSLARGAKNWVATHKKQLLIGSVALAIIATYILCTYSFQSTLPLPQETTTVFFNQQPSIVQPASAQFFNITAHQCINPRQLLAEAERCAYPPTHCWGDPAQVRSSCIPFVYEGKAYDCSRIGCSSKILDSFCALYRKGSLLGKCYKNVQNYVHLHSLKTLENAVKIAYSKAARFWDSVTFYR
jgi:hypothetical protein